MADSTEALFHSHPDLVHPSDVIGGRPLRPLQHKPQHLSLASLHFYARLISQGLEMWLIKHHSCSLKSLFF